MHSMNIINQNTDGDKLVDSEKLRNSNKNILSTT